MSVATVVVPAVQRFGTAGELVVGHASTAAGTVYQGGQETKSKNTALAIVGYSLVLILLYVLVADKRVVSAATKLVGGAQTAAEAWVAPADPIALLSERFGATPSSTGSSAGAGAATEITGSSVGAAGGKAPESSAELTAQSNARAGKTAPAPSAAGNLRVARRQYGTAAPGFYARLRQEAIRKGVLRP